MLGLTAMILCCQLEFISTDKPSSAEEVIRRCLASRDSIVDLHASVVMLNKLLDRDQQQATFEIWQTAKSYRVDIDINNKKAASGKNEENPNRDTRRPRTIVCDNCEKPGWLFMKRSKDEHATFALANSEPNRVSRERQLGIDMKSLGMKLFPYPSLLVVDVNGVQLTKSILNDPEFSKYILAESRPDGKYKLTSKNIRTDMELSVWFDSTLGYAVYKISGTRVDKQGEKSTFDMEASGFKKISDLLWYPSLIEINETTKGKVFRTEKFDIKIHSCNQPISPSVFTVASMALDNGVKVYTSESKPGNFVIWDGKIVSAESLTKTQAEEVSRKQPERPITPPTPTNPEAVAQPFRWYYIAAAVLFSGIAVYFFRRMLNRG